MSSYLNFFDSQKVERANNKLPHVLCASRGGLTIRKIERKSKIPGSIGI